MKIKTIASVDACHYRQTQQWQQKLEQEERTGKKIAKYKDCEEMASVT